MGKGGSAKQRIDEYRMSIHYGIAAELDAITGILVGEKEAWTGALGSEGAIGISAPELFGGQKKEGGVGGIAYFLPGGPNQILPQGFAQRRGLSSATHPAYRGLASIYMVGTIAPGEGFYWGNTPYMNGVWVKGRRAPKGLNPAYAMIGNRTEFAADGYTVTVNGQTATLINGQQQLVGGYGVTVTVNESQKTRVIGFGSQTVTIYYRAHIKDGNIVNDGTGGMVIDMNGAFAAGDSVNINGIAITASGGNVEFHFGASGQDANPAHIIYECLTNTTWGMGANDGIVDRENFESVGRVLFNEGFGMSLAWTRQSSIETFITEVIDHIQAALYVDPQTGKITIKLFRDDYDSTTLPLITPDNADLDSFQRKLWGETINEVVVTWTNPANEQEETITQQDLGNITVQGSVVSDSRNYYGVRNAALASRLALRDSRQSAAPLASVEAKLDRTQWNLRPGSIVRLSWPEYDIVNLVMRVTTIDYGKIGVPYITVSLLEDIFSLEDAAYNAPPASGWINPATDPTPMDHVRVVTAPAYFSSRRLSAADAAMLEYPDVLVAILAATSNPDASLYELIGQSVLPNGQTVAEEIGTRPTLGYATLQNPLTEEAVSTIPTFGVITGGTVPSVSGFVFIGDASERIMEIALLDSFNENGWTLRRGSLDTVPRAWPAGTPMWFYDIRNDFFDPDLRSEGESANFKLLTITSKGRLPLSSAPVVGAVLTARPHLPNRPANVKIAGQPFGTVDLSASPPSSVNVTWSNRNRTMEDGTIVHWTDATVVPETGQTTTIKVLSTAGAVLATHTGLTGTSYDLPVSDWGGNSDADIMITSQRDSFESLQSIVRRVRVSPSGDAPGNPATPGEDDYNPGQTFPPPWSPPCLDADSRYLLSNATHDGPADTCSAYELVAGQTWLWTQDAVTKVWGSHLVMAVELTEEDVMRADDLPRATPLHPFWLDGVWVRMNTIGVDDGRTMVARVTVEGAASYVTVQPDGRYVLSHNAKVGRTPDEREP